MTNTETLTPAEWCAENGHEDIDHFEPNPDSTRLIPYCTYCGASGEDLYDEDGRMEPIAPRDVVAPRTPEEYEDPYYDEEPF